MSRTGSPTILPTLDTVSAGTLFVGDEFEFQPGGTGTGWGVFTFRGVVYSPSGVPAVNAFGGEPVRAEHKHDRAWRSFHPEQVITGARPVRSTWRSKRAPR